MSCQSCFTLARWQGDIIVGINAPDILSSTNEMINFVLAKI